MPSGIPSADVWEHLWFNRREDQSTQKRNRWPKAAHEALGRSSSQRGDNALDGASRRETEHREVSVSWEANGSRNHSASPSLWLHLKTRDYYSSFFKLHR